MEQDFLISLDRIKFQGFKRKSTPKNCVKIFLNLNEFFCLQENAGNTPPGDNAGGVFPVSMTSLTERVREDYSNGTVIEGPEGDDEDGHGILGSTPEHTPCLDSETGHPIYTRINKKRDIVNGESPDENANTTLLTMAAKKYKQISFEKEEVS